MEIGDPFANLVANPFADPSNPSDRAYAEVLGIMASPIQKRVYILSILEGLLKKEEEEGYDAEMWSVFNKLKEQFHVFDWGKFEDLLKQDEEMEAATMFLDQLKFLNVEVQSEPSQEILFSLYRLRFMELLYQCSFREAKNLLQEKLDPLIISDPNACHELWRLAENEGPFYDALREKHYELPSHDYEGYEQRVAAKARADLQRATWIDEIKALVYCHPQLQESVFPPEDTWCVIAEYIPMLAKFKEYELDISTRDSEVKTTQ